MGEHFVVVYVNEASRRFTATARMARARMAVVDQWAAERGYVPSVVAEGLGKDEAETLLKRTRADYEARGYEYQTR